jgi:hypothetical protein
MLEYRGIESAQHTAGDHIAAVTSFSTNVMTRFGLPRTLPESVRPSV